MKVEQLRVRAVRAGDLERLARFRCSKGEPWEELVETQIRGPLPRRYLAAPPRFDGRMLVVIGQRDVLLAVGAHHIEPTLVPDVGYTEVIAVALPARGTRVELSGGSDHARGVPSADDLPADADARASSAHLCASRSPQRPQPRAVRPRRAQRGAS